MRNILAGAPQARISGRLVLMLQNKKGERGKASCLKSRRKARVYLNRGYRRGGCRGGWLELSVLAFALLLPACDFPLNVSGPKLGPDTPAFPKNPSPSLFLEPFRPQIKVNESVLLYARLEGGGTETAILEWKVGDEGIVSIDTAVEFCNARCVLATGKAPGVTTVDVSTSLENRTLGAAQVVTVTR